MKLIYIFSLFTRLINNIRFGHNLAHTAIFGQHKYVNSLITQATSSYVHELFSFFFKEARKSNPNEIVLTVVRGEGSKRGQWPGLKAKIAGPNLPGRRPWGAREGIMEAGGTDRKARYALHYKEELTRTADFREGHTSSGAIFQHKINIVRRREYSPSSHPPLRSHVTSSTEIVQIFYEWISEQWQSAVYLPSS